jgi:alanine dehydrogenase
MKFGIIRERKNPPDRRVVFSPEKLKEFKDEYKSAEFIVESSNIRVFSDQQYKEVGFEITQDMSSCDVLFGVKEVPIDSLIPNKKYFFFSHTIKKQPYNRDLMRAILDKNIELYDHETIAKENGNRLIGFGRYAGIVGAYNGFRAIGLKNATFTLPKAETLAGQVELIAALNAVDIPKYKILLTGNGRVAYGAKEMLDAMRIRRVSVQEYLENSFEEPVYCLVDVLDYNKHKVDKNTTNRHFYTHPLDYVSDFFRFAKVTDFFIAGHFYGSSAPYLFTREEAKSKYFKIKFVADISCDVDGPVASTLRASTIEDPIYGYDPNTASEVDYKASNAIVVMAVDNLPCELPKDASEGFGALFLENVIPAFFNDDKDGVLQRAKMTANGKLTTRFSYLQAYIDGKE